MRPDLLEAHLADMALRGLVPETTIYARQRTLARLAAALDVPVADATAADLLAWRAGLAVSPRSVASYCIAVRRFYAWLAETGYRPDNPAARIPVPRSARGLPRPIGEDDLFAAVESAPRRIRPMLALAGWATLRAKEIALLRRENVLDTAPRPFILVAEDATKGHSARVVWMSQFVLDELRACGMPSSGWVFRRHDGTAGPNAAGYVSKLCNRYLRAQGIDATLHQLRHRCLTVLHDQTLDIRLVQEAAGHRSLESTQIYTLVSNPKAAAAMEAIPAPKRLRVVSE